MLIAIIALPALLIVNMRIDDPAAVSWRTAKIAFVAATMCLGWLAGKVWLP